MVLPGSWVSRRPVVSRDGGRFGAVRASSASLAIEADLCTAIDLIADGEDALWQTVQILLRPKENPAAASTLLTEKLLPLHRTPEYEDALREAEAALGIERPRA